MSVILRCGCFLSAGPQPTALALGMCLLHEAAPELLEVLKDLTALYMASPGCDPHFIAKARAAIAKATSPQAPGQEEKVKP